MYVIAKEIPDSYQYSIVTNPVNGRIMEFETREDAENFRAEYGFEDGFVIDNEEFGIQEC